MNDYAGSASVIRADARSLPIAHNSVDLIVTSPPYWGLRSYRDAGQHYTGQVGSEATSEEFVRALLECTQEMTRVLKPSGSIFVNLGDKYGKDKGLRGLPWRYALRCMDELGLILRAEIIWSKPNGIPESVKDRVRRSHEQWFHFTVSPRYFAAVDEIRETYSERVQSRQQYAGRTVDTGTYAIGSGRKDGGTQAGPLGFNGDGGNPLGKLPGSVREVPTAPLKVPAHLGVDHFAAFPPAWPAWLIRGWAPEGGTVLDPFGGTGTTALAAKALGRHGISVDLSADYCRLAEWRTNDPKELAKIDKLLKTGKVGHIVDTPKRAA